MTADQILIVLIALTELCVLVAFVRTIVRIVIEN